jgi:Flp pilus assembly pilin Flp
MLEVLRALIREDAGVSAVEYGLIAGVFVPALIASFTVFGQTLAQMTEDVRTHLVQVTPTP